MHLGRDSEARFGQDFEVEVQARFEARVWSVFCCRRFVKIMKLNLGRDSEARFGQYLEFMSASILNGYNSKGSSIPVSGGA